MTRRVSGPDLVGRRAELAALLADSGRLVIVEPDSYAFSTKTASVHVSNILRGVRSRIQAAALANRRQEQS